MRSIARHRTCCDTPGMATAFCTAPVTASASVHGTGVNMDDYETRRPAPVAGDRVLKSNPAYFLISASDRDQYDRGMGSAEVAAPMIQPFSPR